MPCEKLELLGGGAHGIVFLSQYYNPPTFSVPMKLAAKSSKVEFSSSLRREGQILKKLQRCPYIIQCLGEDTSVEHGNTMYNLLLEYAPGATLKRWMNSKEGFIPEGEASLYAYQLLKGILEVHRLGIVHCDLKPNNILLFPCRCGCGLNQLKIGDFRLSKVAGEGGHRGALLYTSPESLFCGMHEAPKDIWAVGCMVAEMMTGESPWKFCYGNGDDKLAQDMAFKQPQIPTGISNHANDFLMKCFERNPNVRWTADKLLNHPFVANTNPLLCQRWEDRQGLGNRAFGTGEWISSIDLFSTPISSCIFDCRRGEGMN